ncbi:hypothetical protein CBS101457_005402 [Exobasidium rhododendri]|nr:hypothetical protein CBS101457_005402 [Exobasidium rhododendri]
MAGDSFIYSPIYLSKMTPTNPQRVLPKETHGWSRRSLGTTDAGIKSGHLTIQKKTSASCPPDSPFKRYREEEREEDEEDSASSKEVVPDLSASSKKFKVFKGVVEKAMIDRQKRSQVLIQYRNWRKPTVQLRHDTSYIAQLFELHQAGVCDAPCFEFKRFGPPHRPMFQVYCILEEIEQIKFAARELTYTIKKGKELAALEAMKHLFVKQEEEEEEEKEEEEEGD